MIYLSRKLTSINKIMKRKITLLLLAAASVFSVKSQVIFQENFTSPFTPATAGWDVQNLSAAANPTLSWFQGNGANVFPAFNGGPNDYFGANFNNTSSSTPATISSWLITPSVTLSNGMVVEFATRTTTNPALFPDRLEVYYSTAGNGTNVGATPTSVGTFSTLLVSVNPNLTSTGYPSTWTIFTGTVSGLAGPTAGRVGFRYFVTNGGSSTTALNSDYIGLDAVKISNPCSQPTLSITQSTTGVCSGNSVTLTATNTGTVAASNFTWSGGQQTGSIVVTPAVTTIYIVSATSASGCVGSQTAQILVTATPTVNVASFTVCSSPATTATLTATGATSYSWSTGSVSNSITVTPGSTTVYTVTGFGAGGNCPSIATPSVTLGGQLSVVLSASSNTICSGRTVTVTAMSAGTTFSWTTGSTAVTTTAAPTASTIYSVAVLSGAFPNVCAGGNTISITVNPTPTLAIAISPTNICSDGDFTVTTSGASTYTYVLSATQAFTTNPIALFAPVVNALTVTGFTLGGTGTNGCIAAGIVTLNVNPNPTVTAVSSAATVCTTGSVTLTGGGANTYQWSGASNSTVSPLTFNSSTAGNKSFTLTGTSLAGCTGTTAISVNVVACNTNTLTVGLTAVTAKGETSIFPNPFTNEIKVDVLEGKVVVYNALGEMVISATVHNSESINTTELPKGAYLVRAYNSVGELVKTSKLIKN